MTKLNDPFKSFEEMMIQCGVKWGDKTLEFQPLPQDRLIKIKSTTIYKNALKDLLENEEFCKSDEWVRYIREQLDVLDILLDETGYDPFAKDELIKNYLINEEKNIARSNGCKAASFGYRKVEEEIIIRAQNILKKPCDGRPAERYRLSSLAEEIKKQNDKLPPHEWIEIPALSTVRGYLKKALINGKLPKFLTHGKPKKW